MGLTLSNETKKDPNDPVRISFTCPPELYEDWIAEKIATLKDYDPGFYVMEVSTRMGTLYQLHTTQKHLEHADFKKFMFQVKMRLGQDVKIR